MISAASIAGIPTEKTLSVIFEFCRGASPIKQHLFCKALYAPNCCASMHIIYSKVICRVPTSEGEMRHFRAFIFLVVAGGLAGCGAHVPVLDTQDDLAATTLPALESQDRDDISTAAIQSDRTGTAEEKSRPKKTRSPPRKPAAPASKNSEEQVASPNASNVGSPKKWEQERAEDERKEHRLKQEIEGICRGC